MAREGATPAEIVREFCSVWERGEFGRFGEFLTDDAVFHMLSLEPVRGPEAIRRECRKLDGLTPSEWHRKAKHPQFPHYDLHFQVEYMAHHEAHHIYQLFQRRVPFGKLPH